MPKTLAEELGMPEDSTPDELRARVLDLAGDGVMGSEEQNEFYDRINGVVRVGIANCGCVHHAEEGTLCPHDIALTERQNKQ